MPISDKIIKKIYELKENSDFKELMLNILKEEDEGTYKYKERYAKMINEFINSTEKEEIKS